MIGARILIADDEPVNRAIVRRVLEPLGCSVVEAADGREALGAVNRETPDLILLDVRMPILDGYSVLRSLKTDPRTRLVPVIMLTALDQLSDKLAAIEIGADEYLAKPFSLQELQTRVRSLLSLKRFTDELEHASHVLEGIAHVVENRDRHTGNHCKRLGEYAARVGGSLGLGESEIKLLRLGGVFHDLGKIAVSDTILNKPARLTPEEFELMKAHPVTGFDLCREMKTMEKVLPLIRHHHEKLDGSGYPDHLKGDEIPLLVRIISVVDVFDALASKRSYKDSLPHARCIEIVREETAKGWWDRDVVETLVKILG